MTFPETLPPSEIYQLVTTEDRGNKDLVGVINKLTKMSITEPDVLVSTSNRTLREIFGVPDKTTRSLPLSLAEALRACALYYPPPEGSFKIIISMSLFYRDYHDEYP